jgi:uncharacterized protein (DUF983 family)
MSAESSTSPATGKPSFLRQFCSYLWRATWLKCPVCGTRPIFLPLHRTRSLHDWFTPLDGCPQCGYPYEREPGYFLMAHWAIGYIVAAMFGTAIFVYLEIWHSDWSLLATLAAVALPVPIVNILFARHAKAYFLAVDHLADPFIPPSQVDGSEPDDGDGGDGGGNVGRRPPTPAGAGGSPVAGPGHPADGGIGVEPPYEVATRRDETAGVR